ncbi:MAG: cytochrome c [Methylococcales bacterium]|nr:cytochrome c [Methylococcales bacterium]
MKTASLFVITTVLLSLNACSKDYSPSEKDTGASMYQTACSNCHKKDEKGLIFTFNKENANIAYITKRIAEGSMKMPKFPNINAQQAEELGVYLLKNSAINP